MLSESFSVAETKKAKPSGWLVLPTTWYQKKLLSTHDGKPAIIPASMKTDRTAKIVRKRLQASNYCRPEESIESDLASHRSNKGYPSGRCCCRRGAGRRRPMAARTQRDRTPVVGRHSLRTSLIVRLLRNLCCRSFIVER